MIKRRTSMVEEMIDGNKEEDVLINVEKLAYCLAEQDYKAQTVGIPVEDLFQVDVVEKEEGVYVEKGIHEHWSNLFFDLKTMYYELIMTFRKK